MKSRCPHTDSFALDGTTLSARRIIEVLAPMIQEERRERIAEVVAGRSYTVVPVLDGLYDLGNVSAVLRSAEALGFQSIHIVESSEKFKRANRVTQGADRWLDISTWETTGPCVEHLRAQGYRIVATHVEAARPIAEIAFDTPTALFFGNERDGLSDELLACADERVVVPMPGFTRSFNISVAAALCLYHVHRDRVDRLGAHGDLSEDEQRYLTASYYLRSIDYAERLLLSRGKGKID
ncbi:MAG: RNA methyltransferase [Candidatus Hydrogenedentes bacterium]|nr:RNA methyltransferase [Candidatus Hydrogenedentota bacterium]